MQFKKKCICWITSPILFYSVLFNRTTIQFKDGIKRQIKLLIDLLKYKIYHIPSYPIISQHIIVPYVQKFLNFIQLYRSLIYEAYIKTFIQKFSMSHSTNFTAIDILCFQHLPYSSLCLVLEYHQEDMSFFWYCFLLLMRST